MIEFADNTPVTAAHNLLFF